VSKVYGSPAFASASVDHPDKISDRTSDVGPDALLNPLSTAFDAEPPATIRPSLERARFWSGVLLNALTTTFDLELIAPSGLHRAGHAPGRRLTSVDGVMSAPSAFPSTDSFAARPHSMP
jgi:hypothetical protein